MGHLEGGVLDCCFSIDVAALCEIKFGDVSNQMAPGTNVHYNKEDGHMYASGADVRRWLPTARKWSLPIAQLEASLADARKNGVACRGLVVINPGNPTGNCLPLENMQEIVRVRVRIRVS